MPPAGLAALPALQPWPCCSQNTRRRRQDCCLFAAVKHVMRSHGKQSPMQMEALLQSGHQGTPLPLLSHCSYQERYEGHGRQLLTRMAALSTSLTRLSAVHIAGRQCSMLETAALQEVEPSLDILVARQVLSGRWTMIASCLVRS